MITPHALHFIGIGGVGMSAIAQIIHQRGGKVTGSDQATSPTVARLQALGIPITVGHDASNLGDTHAIVTSTAVGVDNPEVSEAISRGLKIFHRSEVLAQLMASHRSVAVCGTHGKTTTTGMMASILVKAGWDPTVLVGGDLPLIGGTARAGHSPYLVAESDESDKSIVRLSAEWVILTNLEADHLDHYRDFEEILATFEQFINSLPEGATVVACHDDPGVRQLLPRLKAKVLTYGFEAGADYRIEGASLSGAGASFAIIREDGGASYEIRVSGRHNVSNAAASIVVATLMGLAPEEIQPGLASFTGVGRRFQSHGTAAGVTVVDDYAHHPTEIRATLAAAKLLGSPVWAIFQPHRYSRTAALFEEFATCFGDVDGLALMDVYGAGETSNGVTTESLIARMRELNPQREIFHWASAGDVLEALPNRVRPGDLVLLMGAGNVNKLAEPLLERLRMADATRTTAPA
ncbi:UDP-N-acetylmuramate--L-alanine ligase [compost metagenome]